jgi:hypothetical protein
MADEKKRLQHDLNEREAHPRHKLHSDTPSSQPRNPAIDRAAESVRPCSRTQQVLVLRLERHGNAIGMQVESAVLASN